MDTNTLKRRGAFISYSRRDKEFVIELGRELRAAGYLIWLDQFDIPTGVRWDDEVEKALRENEIFLIILTPASVASENVKDEIGYAIDHGKHILPILLKPCDVPLRLRRFQYVDFTNIDFDEGLRRTKQLLDDLLHEPSRPVGATSPEPAPQKSITSEASPTDPYRETRKPVRRRGLADGIIVLVVVACLGSLSLIILRQALSSAATLTRTPPAAEALATATELQTNTSPSAAEASPAANYKPMSESTAIITDRKGARTSVPADTLHWCTLEGGSIPLDNGYTVKLDTLKRIDIVRAEPAGGKTLFSMTLLDGSTIQGEGLTCSFNGQTSLGRQEFWSDQIQSVEIMR